MRLRLLFRRLTISAPRMAVRSALPWPFRWAVFAIVFGFCAAIGLWAFEFGRDIAGLDHDTKEALKQARTELLSLRSQVSVLEAERNKAQSVANTVDTLLMSEKVMQDKLTAQNRQLEADNRALRDELGFFEKLIPTAGAEGVSIRGLQVEAHNGREMKWQVLVIQALKNPSEFSGKLELNFTGLLDGKPWSASLPGGPQAIRLTQYGRIEGVYELPAQVVLKGITARVLQGSAVKAVQSIKL
jgi:hypothetical protein